MYTFIESSTFERICPIYLDDDEYAELQQFMMRDPEAGRIVPASGGVRKLRWSREGMGKRSGLRQHSSPHPEATLGGVRRCVSARS